MNPRNGLVALLAVSALTTSALAQGSNDCATPTPIAGLGSFAVDTTGATDSAQQPSGCPAAHRDVWFVWTSPISGMVNVNTCGTVSADSVLAVYSGSACPTAGTQLGCNDDACNLQSTVNFTAVAGSTYMIQAGAYGASTTYTGTINFAQGTTGGCPSPTTGPDVIVADITGTINTAVSGGLDALALGTTSCNIGDTVLNWIASTNQHPVIGGNLYKHKVVDGAGRFEQLGMSWLKHGFAALTGNVCCTCQNPGNGQLLGVGCSDPYGASLNGSQSGLGPRWQVNATSGVFTYPPANPSWSGPVARRLQVAVSDLEPSSASVRYLGECMYVTPDDAAAGNQNNNYSNRPINVTGGPADYTFNVGGTTSRMMPALRVWPQFEPGVTLTDAQVTGDGLYLVGSNATDLGGGVYHYEFAVENLNSDRSGGSFSVPLPAGVTPTNVGFRDVAYRNGDGPGNLDYSGTDWTVTVAGGAITWATETQAQNTRANALRWGTTYNFRFDANVAPVQGSVTLGLWKPGTPTQIQAAAEVPGGIGTVIGYCFGDGSATACPCGNAGTPGAGGCLNSLGTSGLLGSAGTASVSADTFTLQGSGMPDSSALYFQGTQQVNSGAGSVFGDGLRCAGGFVTRLGTQTNVLGSSQYPEAGDPLISVSGATLPGNVRTYQCWYRNAASFCTADTWNLTNGLQATWQP
jgi:hypothetical protein